MRSVAKKFALAALCTAALSATASAAPLFSINDAVLFNSFAYSTASQDNNVVNVPASTIVDGAAPSTWWASGRGNANVSVVGLAPGQNYNVQYTYLGSESGDVIRFSAPGVANFNENNANNNCATCGVSPQTGVVNMGTGTLNTIAFNLFDTRVGSGANITNGGTNPSPASGQANLIFSYANFVGGKYVLTLTQTAFVVFGFNDDGAQDDNHDDFMGALTLIPGTIGQPTPIPGALPLFGSVLGGGLLFRRLRKRAKSA
jgi:hypothetical protein